MRSLFLAAAMLIGAFIATSTLASVLQDRALASRADARAAWEAPPPLDSQYPAAKR